MPDCKTLHEAFIDELRDTYDAEKQIIKALPKVIRQVSSDELRDGLEDHLQQTRGHVERLEQVFGQLNEKVRGKHCDGMAGILEEGKSAMEEEMDDASMDAVLIASCQRVEHYEMAAYGTLVAWARAMGHRVSADLLQETLEEEKNADKTLTAAAEGGINTAAARSSDQAEGDDDAPTPSRPAVKRTAKAKAKPAARGRSSARSAARRRR